MKDCSCDKKDINDVVAGEKMDEILTRIWKDEYK